MAEPISDREIYELLEKAIRLFSGQQGSTEGGQAVIDLFLRNTDMIQRAMLIMLSENRPQSGPEPSPPPH
jgi:hypothetical protein